MPCDSRALSSPRDWHKLHISPLANGRNLNTGRNKHVIRRWPSDARPMARAIALPGLWQDRRRRHVAGQHRRHDNC